MTRHVAREWLLWLAALALVTIALLSVRARLNEAHVALAFLIVVQLGAARGGRWLGFLLAGLAFLAMDVLFLPPYGTLAIRDPLDLLVLAAFLVSSLVAAQLLYLARRAAQVGERAQFLVESHRAKDAVLAGVSHDIRTPLTTIKGLAQSLARDGDDRAQVIEEEADRLIAFVGKLLDLSRVTSGTAAPDIQLNEVEDLLGAVSQRVAGRLGDRELVFRLESGEPLLIGRFDFAETLRALANLVENAARFGPAGRPIELRVRRVGVMLEIAVHDEGPGVPAEERSRIFEPFYRPARSQPDAGGVGLGLSIARGIARAQGGDLELAGDPGPGCTFIMTVPAVSVEELARMGDGS